MGHKYEIEIKSLLGNKENAERLTKKMKEKDPSLQVIGSHKQLNHYFIPAGGDLKKLYDNVKDAVDHMHLERLKEIAEHATDFSVRTRWADGKILLVVKASVDDTTSFNGTARLEWESQVFSPSPLARAGGQRPDAGKKSAADDIQRLDDLVLKSGFEYQAKWSRERQEFVFHPAGMAQATINVSLDKNAGYGHLAEFEMVIDDQSKAEETKAFIRSVMQDLETEELMQDRLTRMFDYYNQNWKDYYGTDKIFVIE